MLPLAWQNIKEWAKSKWSHCTQEGRDPIKKCRTCSKNENNAFTNKSRLFAVREMCECFYLKSHVSTDFPSNHYISQTFCITGFLKIHGISIPLPFLTSCDYVQTIIHVSALLRTIAHKTDGRRTRSDSYAIYMDQNCVIKSQAKSCNQNRRLEMGIEGSQKAWQWRSGGRRKALVGSRGNALVEVRAWRYKKVWKSPFPGTSPGFKQPLTKYSLLCFKAFFPEEQTRLLPSDLFCTYLQT